jgi:GNAT superfamily N-acetyltransferase
MPTETGPHASPTLPMTRITGALPEDGDDVALLLAAQFDEHSIAFDEPALRMAVRGAIEQPSRGEFLVAHDRASGHERPIGLAYLAYIWTLEHGGQCAWLEELYVTPSVRSRGVGTALLREAIARALTKGCRAMDLEIDADHARAANLYVRAGFHPHRRARWYLKL